MAITTADIKQLREMTGAGILECKKALQAADGDIDQAVDALRKKGLAAASKKASREANDGIVKALVSADGSVAAMVEVNCETDFVARTDDFLGFADAILRQVVEQPITSVDALLEAPFIDNPSQTVAQRLTETIAKLGENMKVRQVARFERGQNSVLDSYIHIGGRVGVLVEVSGGSADNTEFTELVHDVALQIAAASPRYVSEADVPATEIEAEKAIYKAQIAEDKKPDNIKERIIEGKLKKWFAEVTLLNQEFVKDNDLTIGKLLQKTGKSMGSTLKIERFARFELGVE
ncbi:MAG: elongation factor Ts [Chloroflexi bacterium]|nr:MAG: elongation factor Ts [Chloroflexota bacterium]